MLTINRRQVKRIARRFKKILEGYNLKEIITLWGILNELVWCAAVNVEAISKCKNGKLIFHEKNIARLICDNLTVVTPLDFLVKYLKKFWTGLTYYSRTAVRRLRQVLSEEFKLFTLEERDWSNPTDRHRAPNPCGSFDVIGALILAKLCEDAALAHYKLEDVGLDWSQPIGNGNYPTTRIEATSLPAHKGYTLVALYNLVFEGVDRWGRDETDCNGQEPRPQVVEALKLADKTLQAEQAFEAVLDADPSRDPELVLVTETFDYVESEIIEGENCDCRIEVSKVISTHLLCEFVRYTMKISPKIRALFPKKENAVNIPAWVFTQGERALAWWQKRIDNTCLLFTEMAPPWVLDSVLPF